MKSEEIIKSNLVHIQAFVFAERHDHRLLFLPTIRPPEREATHRHNKI